MIPGDYSPTLQRGDSWGITVRPTTSDGSPIDLTGWTATAQVRSKADSTDVLATMTVVVGANDIAVSLPPAETARLSGKLVWDLETVDAGGIVRTLLSGTLTIVADVTRVVP